MRIKFASKPFGARLKPSWPKGLAPNFIVHRLKCRLTFISSHDKVRFEINKWNKQKL